MTDWNKKLSGPLKLRVTMILDNDYHCFDIQGADAPRHKQIDAAIRAARLKLINCFDRKGILSTCEIVLDENAEQQQWKPDAYWIVPIKRLPGI